MIAIAPYLIKSILISGTFYFYYQLLLKDKRFHSFNRYFLLSVVAISVVMPLIDWNLQPAAIEKNPLIESVERAGTIAEKLPNYFIVAIGYFTVCFNLLTILVIKIRWIYKVKKSSKCTQSDGFTFIETYVKEAPFSFLNNLFWKEGLPLEDTNSKKIFDHELTHIKQGHTYDHLFVQTLSIVFWVNPFYWLLKKELATIHEFIADEVAIGDSDTEAFASMLLYTHNNGSYLSPSHHFFNSQIKRRLTMIGSSKQTSYAWLRKISVVPVAFATILALSLDSKAQTSPNSESPVVQVTTDSIPKKLQEKTVVGYGTKNNKQGVTPPASQEALKEVTVVGYGTKNDKQAATPPASQEALKEVTVLGYGTKNDKQAATPPASQEVLKEVTVVGYGTKNDKQAATPPASQEALKEITVVGYGTKNDKQAATPPASQEALKEITVVGYGTKNDKQAETPPASQESLKEVTVPGQKLEKKDADKKE